MEDRPPVNITSPGPVPINLNICKMRITRDDNGTFQIQPENHLETDLASLVTATVPRKDRELLSMQLVMQQLKLDNDILKKKLAVQEKSTESLKWVVSPAACPKWFLKKIIICARFAGWKLTMKLIYLKIYWRKLKMICQYY